MIPYGKQHIDEADREAVRAVLEGAYVTQGPLVEQFEERIAEYAGARFAVAVNSGTTALHLAYLAAGIGSGDEVIMSPNTFVATANMALAVGVRPVFCDISLDTYNIDESKIEACITERTKAIVAVDFAGNPCAYTALWHIAQKHKLLLIDDAAHALGARYDGQPIGTQADITTFSFHPVKPITTAEGGMVVTNNEQYARKMRLLRSHGVAKDEAGNNVMTELGFNYRLPDVLAALGLSQMDKLDSFIEQRRQVAAWYADALADCAEIVLPQETEGAQSGWHIYVVRTTDPNMRDPLRKHLHEHGIGVNFHYPAVYSHPYYRAHGYADTALPNMETYHARALTLPCYPSLKEEEVAQIAIMIRAFFTAAPR